MEFRVSGSDGLVGSGIGFTSPSSDHPTKQKWCGSAAFLKKEISGISLDNNNGDWKPTKTAKLSDDLTPTKSLLFLKHTSSIDFSDGQQEQNMLSFSSSKLEHKTLQSSSACPYFQHPNLYYSKSSGYSCGGSLNPSMYFVNGVRQPFTPSQWFELEQQALIYKYIIANEPVPPNLLIPIRRAFESAGFCTSFPGGLLRPNAFGYGWGPFHLGLANSTDPEPGRCRRTDGKKWRCSRDAVPDQKYCERHINRGRHRSRKPVEGHSGHSISGGTTTTNKAINSTKSVNVMNMASTSSALVVPGGAPSNSFAINLNNQSKDLQSVPSNHLTSSLVNRLMVDKANISQGKQEATGLDFLSPRMSLNSSGNTFSAVAESTAGDFAFLTSDAVLSTAKTGSSVSTTYAQGSNLQHSPRTFIDDQASILWPKLVQTQTDRTTQLSISIPPASDFMSSTSSPTGERETLSPLRLSRELDSIQMGLGMDTTVSNERSPISWETSMGGPLGEALKTTTSGSSGDQSKTISALNLLSKGCWEGSPQLASSPTDVLQRTALGYFSNSSAGSSPRPENGLALENGSLCGELIGFTLASSSSSLPL